jgi:cytochrome P450
MHPSPSERYRRAVAGHARSEADAARNRAMGSGVVDDPYPLMHTLRARCPVVPGGMPERLGVPPSVPPGDAGDFSVLSHDDVRRVLREEGYSSRWYDPLVGHTIGTSMLNLDPPEHQRHRFLLQPAFSPRAMERWEHEIVRPVVRGYLGPLGGRRGADLYDEFAAHVPIHVMAQALGLPPGDDELFVDWAVTMTSFVEPPERRLAASRALGEYIGPLVAERRARPGAYDDLLSTLVEAQVPVDAGTDDVPRRDPLTDEEVKSFVRLLVVAGASTVYRGFGLLLFALLSHRDQLSAVLADRTLVPQAVEEALRWEQPVASVGRTCTAAHELGGVHIPIGASVVVELGAANHDPSVWADPDRFDIFRPTEPHLTFGLGRHLCLGIHLARMELRVMLDEVLDALPGIRFDPAAPTARVTGLQFRMVTGLPVVWGDG